MGRTDILPDGIRMEHPSPHGVPPDSKQVDELFEVYFNETLPNEQGNAAVKAEYRHFIDEWLLRNEKTVLLFDEDRLIGWGGIQLYEPGENKRLRSELRSITIHPHYQGRGLSKVLTDELEENITRFARSQRLAGTDIFMTSHNPRILNSAVKRGYERVSLEEIYRRCNWPMDSEEAKKKFEWLKSAGMEAVIKSKDIARVSVVDDWVSRFRKRIGF